jgi:hypothetical protein
MGKAAKTRRSEQRKKEKRSRKLQQQALYEGYRARGTNQKDKRKSNRGVAGGVKTTRHAVACGNHGCSRATCHPELAAPKMNDSNDPRVRFKTTEDLRKAGKLKARST